MDLSTVSDFLAGLYFMVSHTSVLRTPEHKFTIPSFHSESYMVSFVERLF